VIVLDASVWLAAVDRDDRFHTAARALVADADRECAALDLTLYEVANVATVRWHDPAQAQRLCRLVLVSCGHRLARVTEGIMHDAIDIADEHGITVYDAAYVAVARRDVATLVSGDVADLVRVGLAVAPDRV
jgi:predicted nucleic acid-binding protein